MQVHGYARIAMAAGLNLISHKLCPYVQRAVIALTEKGVPFERIDIDLANKPDWFLKVSPLGKTPVLLVGDHAIFESAVILEYLEETQANPLDLVDAVFGPVFRYFDVFDEIGDFRILTGKPKLARWRGTLAARPSVKSAVGA